MRLKQSTSAVLCFLMLDTADNTTGKTGLTPTVTLSKAGGSFASPGGSVAEIGNGWYKLTATTTDTNTLGALILHATASGAVPADALFEVYDANEAGDALLKRDWTAISGEASRSVLNALRFLRNKWSISGTTLTVTEEDDTTSAWSATLTASPGADPISGSDPT